MRAVASATASQQSLRVSRVGKQTRARSTRVVVSQHTGGSNVSPAAAAVAIAVTAALPLLNIPGAHAYVHTWQPVAIVAEEEVAAPIAEAVEAPAVEVAVADVTETPAESAAETEASALKDEVSEVLEEAIPAVEAEIASITEPEQQQVAEDMIDLVEEEATAADEELDRGEVAPSSVAKLLETIQSQLGGIKLNFGLK